MRGPLRFLLIFSLLLASACPAAAKSKAAGEKALREAFLKDHPAPPATSNGQRPIILDPGHGGNDLGAITKGKQEKDLCLAIARKVKDRLASHPAKMTRDSDVFIPLDERVGGSLDWGGAAFVSLHINQVRSKNLQGITVYAFGRSNYRHTGRPSRRKKPTPLPPPPREQARASASFAGYVAKSLKEDGFRVDPPARAEYYVLKNPSIPSILIEMGYLSNPEEAARLADPAYQDKLAAALARSIEGFMAKAAAPASKATALASAVKP